MVMGITIMAMTIREKNKGDQASNSQRELLVCR